MQRKLLRIIWCGFWHNKSSTDQIFCICQIPRAKSESTSAICHLQQSLWFRRLYCTTPQQIWYNHETSQIN